MSLQLTFFISLLKAQARIYWQRSRKEFNAFDMILFIKIQILNHIPIFSIVPQFNHLQRLPNFQSRSLNEWGQKVHGQIIRCQWFQLGYTLINTMSTDNSKYSEEIQPYLDPLKFYNHGDNPVLKNFMKIALENSKDGYVIDHRTFVVDKGQRYLMARNWDDLLQRDLHAITFPRALGFLALNTMFFLSTTRIARNLLPVGRFGIRSITETPLYHNFGPIGVAGALGVFFVGAYTEYKTFKFTLHKFYRHVLMGERNWFLEEKRNTSRDGQYDYSDVLMGNEETFSTSKPEKLLGSLKRDWAPSYEGPYSEVIDESGSHDKKKGKK